MESDAPEISENRALPSPPSSLAFDDGNWKSVDLAHDWVIGLPFQNDPSLTSKSSYPVGRGYPETSIGWYRKVFELPVSDSGRRITVEFDGAYREVMVVFNGLLRPGAARLRNRFRGL